MPYRKLSSSVTWHWCHNCSGWPLHDFRQREDEPPTWNGQAWVLYSLVHRERLRSTRSL
jgi:hypothetical protein